MRSPTLPSLNIYLLRLAVCLLIGACVAVATPHARAQVVAPATLEAELERRGIDRDVAQQRLLAAGIDVTTMSQAELLARRPEISAILAELESEAQAVSEQAQRNLSTETADDISQAVREGATLEEAIAEEVTEAANEEPSREAAFESRIYGHAVFADGSLEAFRNVDKAVAPGNYRLGPGDEIAVNIFGQSQVDLLLRVDERGFVSASGIPKLLLKGVTLDQARELVRRRLQQYYVFTDGQFNLTVNGARTVRVNVFGEVERSGTYTLSALNGAFAAISAAGGPSASGSVRRIRRDRAGVTSTLDLYEYLTDPTDYDGDLSLTDGDILFLPVVRKVVNVRGGVRRPMMYELLRDEGLTAAIDFAGGFTSGAYQGLVQIERVREGRKRIIDVDAARLGAGSDVELLDGDIVTVRSIENPVADVIGVSGAVDLPGEFAYRAGLTVGDVVAQARLREGARRDVALIERRNDDGTTDLLEVDLAGALSRSAADIALNPGDQVRILTQAAYADDATVALTGAVRQPIASYPYSRDTILTLERLILLAGGLATNASDTAVVFRRSQANEQTLRYDLFPISRERLASRLSPLDSVVIYPREYFSQPFTVSLRGAVRQQGNYRYDPSLGLRELFTIAGGLDASADPNRIDVFRLDAETGRPTETKLGTIELDDAYAQTGGTLTNFDLRPYDVIVVRSKPEYELIQTVNIEGEVTYPGIYPISRDIPNLRALVEHAGGLTWESFPEGATLTREADDVGIVVIDLPSVMRDRGAPSNIALRPGDVLFVPKAQELVALRTTGTEAGLLYADSVASRDVINVAYHGPRSAKWYVERFAGGFAEKAKRSSLTVRQANGALKRTRNFLFFKSYPTIAPGATVQLSLKPEKAPEERREREPINWGVFVRDTIAIATSALTVILLAQRLE